MEANKVCVRTHSPSSLVSRENRVTDRLQSQYCCGFLFQGNDNSSLRSLTLRSILAKPRALDARSLASWNSSLSDRLVSITDRLTESKGSKLKKQQNIQWDKIYQQWLKHKSDSQLFLLPDLIWGGAVICTFPEFITTLLQAGIEELSSGFKQHPSNVTAKSRTILIFI